MAKKIHIFRKILKNGVEIKLKNKNYKVTYPTSVWEKLPKSLRKIFADSLSYITTWHLPLLNDSNTVYHFTHPPIEPVFFKILLYSIPTNIFEYENINTTSLIKTFYNSYFQTEYKGLHYPYSGKKTKKSLKEKAILLFSFGKDSLLTYGLLDELGIAIVPIFIKEPQLVYENAHKRKLAQKFYQKFLKEVPFFPLKTGKLRQEKDFYWGWDIILSQYAFVLIPYYFYHQAKYLFFGNEQSCNFFLKDPEGYFINPVFEQSVPAMQFLQDIPKLFFINTHIGSLVEPIHEIFITYILHHRYPELGKFQMSCFSDETESKKKRWCGRCEKCARMYIFLKALGIPPANVGFYNNDMLSQKKENLYVIFDQGRGLSTYAGSGLGKNEQLLAFFLAYKNKVKGELIDKFKKMYLHQVEAKKEKLIKEFFGIHSSYSSPTSLRRKTLRIFSEEQQSALNYLKPLLSSS